MVSICVWEEQKTFILLYYCAPKPLYAIPIHTIQYGNEKGKLNPSGGFSLPFPPPHLKRYTQGQEEEVKMSTCQTLWFHLKLPLLFNLHSPSSPPPDVDGNAASSSALRVKCRQRHRALCLTLPPFTVVHSSWG